MREPKKQTFGITLFGSAGGPDKSMLTFFLVWRDSPQDDDYQTYGDPSISVHSLNNNEILEFRFGEINQYTLQIEAFSHAIQEKNSDHLFSLEDSYKNQLVIDGMFEAGKNDRIHRI